MRHYGGTMGLYEQPRDEQVRALAIYEHLDYLARPKKARGG